MAQQPIVGDHCFLLSEFRDALVKYVLQRYDIFSKKHIPWYLQRRFGSLVAEIRFQYGHFFRKKISSSFPINVDEPNLITVPHFGQHTGAFGRKPPSIAMSSCPQQGHLALLIPVNIVSSLLCFTASDATGIVHSVLHQLAAGKHGHCSNEQFDRKFQKILFHILSQK